MKVIIADTSCLILYNKIKKLAILKETFVELTVTKEVALEFGPLPDWINIVSVSNIEKINEFDGILGIGEASSIALALETPNALLIIDEKKGRNHAKALDIQIIGSLGLLIIAKQKGIIHSVKEILLLIEETNFRISEPLKKTILEIAGESY